MRLVLEKQKKSGENPGESEKKQRKIELWKSDKEKIENELKKNISSQTKSLLELELKILNSSLASAKERKY